MPVLTLAATAVNWAAGVKYSLWQQVINGGNAYMCICPHTSGSTFDFNNWVLIGATGQRIPVTGTDGTVGGSGGTPLTSTFSGVVTVQQGSLSAIPGASGDAQQFYYATDANILYYSNGTTWIPTPAALGTADGQLPGVFVPPIEGQETTTLLVANQAYVRRFSVDRPLAITLAAFYVSTAATANDNCDVGIYLPNGTRVASNGGVAGKLNSTGVQTVPLAYTLMPGIAYDFAFACGPVGGTAASLITNTGSSGLLTRTLFGASSGSPGLQVQGIRAASYPLPASLGTISSAAVPKAALRVT